MKKFICLILLALVGCDDGDINIPSFEFEETINFCGDIILHKENTNGTESLILQLNKDNTSNIFFLTEYKNETITINNSNIFSYRIFSDAIDNSYFCQSIPPQTPTVINEWEGSGTVLLNTVFSIDDNDNVNIDDEKYQADGTTLLNTDGDDYPDYVDIDDDNDGIPTTTEDLDGDNNPFNDDTDNDGIPNFRDNDDDNDGTLTINESITGDLNNNNINDYLDPDTLDKFDARDPLTNNYQKVYNLTIHIENMILTNGENEIKETSFSFGSIETKTPTSEVVDFN